MLLTQITLCGDYFSRIPFFCSKFAKDLPDKKLKKDLLDKKLKKDLRDKKLNVLSTLAQGIFCEIYKIF